MGNESFFSFTKVPIRGALIFQLHQIPILIEIKEYNINFYQCFSSLSPIPRTNTIMTDKSM